MPVNFYKNIPQKSSNNKLSLEPFGYCIYTASNTLSLWETNSKIDALGCLPDKITSSPIPFHQFMHIVNVTRRIKKQPTAIIMKALAFVTLAFVFIREKIETFTKIELSCRIPGPIFTFAKKLSH